MFHVLQINFKTLSEKVSSWVPASFENAGLNSSFSKLYVANSRLYNGIKDVLLLFFA
jgi:hypothetical protein